MSLIPVTLASVLASFSGNNGVVEEAVISTHVSPEISGLWELDLGETPDFIQNTGSKDTSKKGETNAELNELIKAIEESGKLDQLQAVERMDGKASSVTNSDPINTGVTGDGAVAVSAINNSCRERYNFDADNKVLTTSGEEWTYGNYIYQYQPEGLPIIAINTSYDNNKTDCSGRRIDQTGESLIAFVDYRPKENKMRWCIDKEGINCFMTFNKLLP